jgi:hypothetical protein
MIVNLKSYDSEFGVWIGRHVGHGEMVRIATDNIVRSDAEAFAMVPGFYRISSDTRIDGAGVLIPKSLFKL